METITTAANVIGECFVNYPANRAIYDGIGRPKELIALHSEIQLKFAIKQNGLYLLEDNPQALMVGFERKNKSRLRELFMFLKIIRATLRFLSRKEVKILKKNLKAHKDLFSLTWPKEFVKGNYFRIEVIAIAEELRGTGAFRRLLSPVIQSCENKGLPIVLETHDERNVKIYEHFGFEVAKVLEQDGVEIKGYCMIRR